jgi:hypothetical protein
MIFKIFKCQRECFLELYNNTMVILWGTWRVFSMKKKIREKRVTTISDGRKAYVGFVGDAERLTNKDVERVNQAAQNLRNAGYDVSMFWGAQNGAPPNTLPPCLHSTFNQQNLALNVAKYENRRSSEEPINFSWQAPGQNLGG